MNATLKYALGRIGLFLICAVPAFLFFPDVNPFFKLLVALVLSAGLSFFLLRGWRDEVAEQMSTNARRRISEKDRLRSALAGEDAPATGAPANGAPATGAPANGAPAAEAEKPPTDEK